MQLGLRAKFGLILLVTVSVPTFTAMLTVLAASDLETHRSSPVIGLLAATLIGGISAFLVALRIIEKCFVARLTDMRRAVGLVRAGDFSGLLSERELAAEAAAAAGEEANVEAGGSVRPRIDPLDDTEVNLRALADRALAGGPEVVAASRPRVGHDPDDSATTPLPNVSRFPSASHFGSQRAHPPDPPRLPGGAPMGLSATSAAEPGVANKADFDLPAGQARVISQSRVERGTDPLGQDEISDLARDLAVMARSLYRARARLEKRVQLRTRELQSANRELEEANRRLKESETRFRAIATSTGDAIISVDPFGTITAFNSAAERMFGLKKAEVLGTSVGRLVPERYHDQHKKLMAEISDGARSLLVGAKRELHARAADGREFPVEMSLSSYRIGNTLEFTALVRDVSERRASEHRLRESEELHRSVVEALEEGVLVIDSEGCVVAANRAAETILGIPMTQLVGWDVHCADWRLLGEDGQEISMDRCPTKMALKSGQPSSNTVLGVQRPDGQLVWVTVNARPLRSSPTGPVTRVVASFTDITWRQSAEKALRESESQYRMLFERHPMPMWVYDPETLAFLAVNETAVQRYGYSREQFLSMSIADIRPPEDLPRMRRVLEKIHNDNQNTGAWETGPWRHRRADGSIIDANVVSLGITFRGRNARLVMSEDITERLRAEKELRESRALYQALVESLPQCIFRKDAQGRFTFGNSNFCQLLGVTPAQLLGKTDEDFSPPELAAKYRHDDAEVIRTGRTFSSVELNRSRDNELRYVQVVKIPLPGPDGQPAGVQGMFWDITETKRLQDDLAGRTRELEAVNRRLLETQAQMIQQEKMAGLGLLTAGVAHEINNPLAFVNNNLAVMERDIHELTAIMSLYRQAWSALASAQPELAHTIAAREATLDLDYTINNLERLLESTRGGISRVRRIVSDLRQFSRLDRADREPADLDECMRVTLGTLGNELRRRELVVVSDFGRAIGVWCWPQKLNQVFLNLLMNAAQASRPGGRIWITTRLVGESAVVEVRDEGVGMPLNVKAQLFNPFFTTKPPGEGTGLGLFICYGIVVREHGGRIEVDSAPGLGTTFRVVLPVRPPANSPDGSPTLPVERAEHARTSSDSSLGETGSGLQSVTDELSSSDTLTPADAEAIRMAAGGDITAALQSDSHEIDVDHDVETLSADPGSDPLDDPLNDFSAVEDSSDIAEVAAGGPGDVPGDGVPGDAGANSGGTEAIP